jgi:5-methyltetrahydrofolate--homocysteine methyltransferase
MKIKGLEKAFIAIGENVHTTRIVLRRGKLVANRPDDGAEAVRFTGAEGQRRYLVIPEDIKRTQDYEEGRVKHVKIAIQAAMSDREPEAAEGMAYLERLVRRQKEAGADFLDLNVDEISLKPEEQQEAIQWLVQTVQEMSSTPLSVDSSNIETIEKGLEAGGGKDRTMLNSASLERLGALDLALKYNTHVMVTAAGEKGMPQDAEERVVNASRMVDAALDKNIAIQDIYIDPLVFPISVDGRFVNHCLDAIRRLRHSYGPEIHISGGFSNVSFGLPTRRLVNDVFFILAIEAGADSGIIDPITSHLGHVFSIDRDSTPYQLAEDMLLGRDRNCKSFLRAFRKGALKAY